MATELYAKLKDAIVKNSDGMQARCDLGKCGNTGRRGIALVVVLGFLAVLTLMAVGMAISMRTERLASKSYLDMVKARFYCESALADSMSFLEEAAYGVGLKPGEKWNPTNKVMPDFLDYFLKSGSGERPVIYFINQRNAFPEHYILPSIETTVGNAKADVFTNSLINGIGTNYIKYIPGRLWRGFVESKGGIGSERLQGKAQWIHVTNGADKVVGRFMYVVINTTGRADINYVDRKIQPSGMCINGRPLKSIRSDDAGYQSFLDDRREDVRYETLRDMRDGNITLSPHEEWNNKWSKWSIEGEAPVDITSFTCFRPMRRIESTENGITEEFVPVYLDPEAETLSASRTEVVNAFNEVIDGTDNDPTDGADWKDAPVACDATELYNLLADYIDDDNHKPHDPEGPSCEAVPMINEMYMTATNIEVEVWEPFVGSNRFERTFEVEIEVNGAKQPKNGPSNRNVPDAFEPFDPEVVNIQFANPITNAVNDLVVKVLDNGTVIDRVDFGTFSTAVQLDKSIQCNDPRFNHHESQWQEAASKSMGDINPVALQGMADNGANPDADGIGYVTDGDHLMYCANSPLVCSGELGYLPVAPWRTLKLYKDERDPRSGVQNMDPVLDYFTVFPPDRLQYGLLNPNEKFDNHYDITQALLGIKNFGETECWKLFPRDDSHRNYHPGKAGSIFRNIKLVVNPFINISDVGQLIFHGKDMNTCKGGSVKDRTELRLECPMRRHSALASVGGQVYTVLLWGQALGEGQGENWDSYPVLSEAQAVAMVWRDPYPNAQGEHRKTVRFIRWFE